MDKETNGSTYSLRNSSKALTEAGSVVDCPPAAEVAREVSVPSMPIAGASPEVIGGNSLELMATIFSRAKVALSRLLERENC